MSRALLSSAGVEESFSEGAQPVGFLSRMPEVLLIEAAHVFSICYFVSGYPAGPAALLPMPTVRDEQPPTESTLHHLLKGAG